MAFASPVAATILPEICENTCTEEDREWLLVPGYPNGWPADQALTLAQSLDHRPLVALHLAWFAVAETLEDVARGAGLHVDGLHYYSPEVLTRFDQPFNQSVDPAVLAHLKAIGEAVDGVRFNQSDSLRDLARDAIWEVSRFVASVPELSERLRMSPFGGREMAMTRDDGLVIKLVRSDADHGFVFRHKSVWVPLVDMFDLDGLAFVGVMDSAIDVYDSCEWAGIRIPIKHYPPSILGPFWPDPVLIDDDEFIYDEETGESRRPDGVVEEDLYILELLGPDKQSARLAYKATLRTHAGTGETFKPLETSCLKTIAGFMNSNEGGTVLIGVADDGTVRGLEGDYASRPNTDQDPRDWFQQHLAKIISTSMGEAAAANVRSYIHHVRGHDICRVRVRPSEFPVHAIVAGRPEDLIRSEFFVRFAKRTRHLDPVATKEYIAQRWPAPPSAG